MIDKQDLKRNAYNKRRSIIFCIACISPLVTAITILILLSFITDETVVLILAIVFVVHLVLAHLITWYIRTYEHPMYGKFNLVDEFNHARKYKYTRTILVTLSHLQLHYSSKKYMIMNLFLKL